MKHMIIIGLLAIAFGLVGCSESLDKEIIHMNVEMEKDIGFARAVRIGDTLYVAGSVGWGEMSEAITIAYDRIDKTLKAQGLSFEQVVKETVYTTNMEALKAAKEDRKKYYTDGYPAATWVQIDRLFNPDLVLEVEVVAYFPSP